MNLNPETVTEMLEALPVLLRDVERFHALARQGRDPNLAARLGLARDSLADSLTALRGLAEAEPEAAKAEPAG